MKTWNIVIPCFNYARYLTGAVESVLASTVQNFALTLVDDGSTDNTAAVIKSYARRDDRVVPVLRAENGGLCVARNEGAEACPSKYILFLDADDKIGSRYLAEAQSLMEQEGADVVYPDRYMFGIGAQMAPALSSATLKVLLEVNTVVVSAACRRSMLESVGLFDPTLKHYEDWDLWLRLAKAGAIFHHLPGLHFYLRLHEGSYSSGYGTRTQWEEAIDVLRERHPDLAPLEILSQWLPPNLQLQQLGVAS